MCLGIPGQVVRWLRREPPFATAEIAFDGVTRECNLSCVPEAEVGDFVVVHAGVAICKVDEQEASRIFELLPKDRPVEESRQDSGWDRPRPDLRRDAEA